MVRHIGLALSLGLPGTAARRVAQARRAVIQAAGSTCARIARIAGRRRRCVEDLQAPVMNSADASPDRGSGDERILIGDAPWASARAGPEALRLAGGRRPQCPLDYLAETDQETVKYAFIEQTDPAAQPPCAASDVYMQSSAPPARLCHASERPAPNGVSQPSRPRGCARRADPRAFTKS